MLKDEHLKVVYFNQNSAEVFPATDIKGGVAVTYRDAKKNFGAIGVFTSFPELGSILKKVEDKLGETLNSIFYPQTKVNQEIDHRFPTERRMRPNWFEKFPDIFRTDKDEEHNITIIGLEKGNKRTERFVSEAIVSDPNIKKYKLFIPKANGSGAIGEVLSTPLIGCTQTFYQVGSFDEKYLAQNCLKYIKSKFARVMLGILKITQDNPPIVWQKVPLQDFTANSDVPWEKSISEIEQYFYQKYELDDKEIKFIEEKVKEMV
jgi:hypothetical protein